MYICTFKYTLEDVDCRFCKEYKHNRCTAANGCSCITERIEANAAGYGEIVRATFQNAPEVLRRRLHCLAGRFPDTMWTGADHEQRFYRLWAELGMNRKRDTPQFFAALYLLTANGDIFRRAYNAFLPKRIEPEYIRVSEISVANYALVQAAKSIYLGTDSFTLADLSDSEAVNMETFFLVVNAILIARYGKAVMHIKRNGRNNLSC